GGRKFADPARAADRLSEPLTGLALADERLVELLLGDEAALDEDVPETAPAGGVLRPGGPTELGPLLRDNARELLARDAEPLDEELAELLTRLALDLEGDADLAFGDESALDEERADESGRKGLRCGHDPCIGSPSNELSPCRARIRSPRRPPARSRARRRTPRPGRGLAPGASGGSARRASSRSSR